jgi:NAD(P)-dependent dehydrogenase (short-subunit alcohol dehydrogenase family)
VTVKTWFITGATRGFGRVFTDAALERGDHVAATARNAATLRPLVDAYGDAVLPVSLDVTDRAATSEAAHSTPNPAYDALRLPRWGSGGFDPKHAGPAMLEIVDAEHPPRRVAFGSGIAGTFPRIYADRILSWETWEYVSGLAGGNR